MYRQVGEIYLKYWQKVDLPENSRFQSKCLSSAAEGVLMLAPEYQYCIVENSLTLYCRIDYFVQHRLVPSQVFLHDCAFTLFLHKGEYAQVK